MSDRMQRIAFGDLLDRALKDIPRGQFLGVEDFYRAQAGNYDYHGEHLECAVGPAAGPHTQLTQNILAGYLCGARFFELKTVQILDGEDLTVEKPCIWPDDEAYNVEWSSELWVHEAMEEYIKAWMLLKVISKEFELGNPDGFVFNMSVGYNLEGIQSPKIDAFLNGLKDASSTDVWKSCAAAIRARLPQLKRFTEEDLLNMNSKVCPSISLSTMHGALPEEIEQIASYLLVEKGLHTAVKLNPTLLGEEKVKELLEKVNYGNLRFRGEHFEADLKLEQALPMLERLQQLGREKNLFFGVKLTNTFPVIIQNQELPGEEMYLSGKALLPLSLSVAILLNEHLPELSISYSGGADFFNLADFLEAGIAPVSVCTTLLKPGGYYRLKPLAEISQQVQIPRRVSGDKLKALLERVLKDALYHRKSRSITKDEKKVPLLQCGIAPCESRCPTDQQVDRYLQLAEEERWLEALECILEDNALPAITGQICYAFCEEDCRRERYDSSVKIREMKALIVEKAHAEHLKTIHIETDPNKEKISIVGAGPSGLAAAYFLRREGHAVSVYDAQEQAGGILPYAVKECKQDRSFIDMDVARLEAMGVEFFLGQVVEDVSALPGRVILATGADRFKQLLPVAVPALQGEAIGEAVEQKKTSVVACIAAAKKLVDTRKKAEEVVFDRELLLRKPFLIRPLEREEEIKRCLHCDQICEACVDVCPNRANLPVEVPGQKHREILHLEAFCNHCGNCSSFCPYDSDPYREKFAIFSSLDEYREEKLRGLYFDGERYHLRLDEEQVLSEEELLQQEGNLGKLLQVLLSDYSDYLRWGSA